MSKGYIGNFVSNGSALLNKMTIMPIYGKTLKIFSRIKKAFRLYIGI